jgi:peroxiredoxin
MNLLKTLMAVLCLSFATTSFSQATNSEGHFLFEPEKFSPPVKDMIASYEGFPATPFMANNINGEELYIGDFKGKVLILLFWTAANPNCTRHLESLNRLTDSYAEQMSIVSFADDDRKTMDQYVVENNVKFHVIPNSKIFGEAAYANELGYPRAFLIDASGVIRKVVPEEAFNKCSNAFEMIKSILVNDLAIIND